MFMYVSLCVRVHLCVCVHLCVYVHVCVTEFEKSHHNYKYLEIPSLITCYLKYCTYLEENRYLHAIHHNSIAICSLSMHQLLYG